MNKIINVIEVDKSLWDSPYNLHIVEAMICGISGENPNNMKTYEYNGKRYRTSSRDRLCRKLGFKPWDIEAKKIKKIKKGAK